MMQKRLARSVLARGEDILMHASTYARPRMAPKITNENELERPPSLSFN